MEVMFRSKFSVSSTDDEDDEYTVISQGTSAEAVKKKPEDVEINTLMKYAKNLRIKGLKEAQVYEICKAAQKLVLMKSFILYRGLKYAEIHKGKSVVAQGCDLSTIRLSYAICTSNGYRLHGVSSIGRFSLDVRRLNELKRNVVDQDDRQVNLPLKKTCVRPSNSFPCIDQQPSAALAPHTKKPIQFIFASPEVPSKFTTNKPSSKGRGDFDWGKWVSRVRWVNWAGESDEIGESNGDGYSGLSGVQMVEPKWVNDKSCEHIGKKNIKRVWLRVMESMLNHTHILRSYETKPLRLTE
ncbi:hypothetical protein Tco_0962915 [Tanacetum coccineum]